MKVIDVSFRKKNFFIQCLLDEDHLMFVLDFDHKIPYFQYICILHNIYVLCTQHIQGGEN